MSNAQDECLKNELNYVTLPKQSSIPKESSETMDLFNSISNKNNVTNDDYLKFQQDLIASELTKKKEENKAPKKSVQEKRLAASRAAVKAAEDKNNMAYASQFNLIGEDVPPEVVRNNILQRALRQMEENQKQQEIKKQTEFRDLMSHSFNQNVVNKPAPFNKASMKKAIISVLVLNFAIITSDLFINGR
jgi:hypothetical protein